MLNLSSLLMECNSHLFSVLIMFHIFVCAGWGVLWLTVIIISWGAGRRGCEGIFVFECHVCQSMFNCCICCISENIVYK